MWTHHWSMLGLRLETGSESQAWSSGYGVSGWEISHGERAGLGGFSSECPWPLLLFEAFLSSLFSRSCRPAAPHLRGNASRGHRGHRSFAVQAGRLF